jgi:hypothetical protein
LRVRVWHNRYAVAALWDKVPELANWDAYLTLLQQDNTAQEETDLPDTTLTPAQVNTRRVFAALCDARAIQFGFCTAQHCIALVCSLPLGRFLSPSLSPAPPHPHPYSTRLHLSEVHVARSVSAPAGTCVHPPAHGHQHQLHPLSFTRTFSGCAAVPDFWFCRRARRWNAAHPRTSRAQAWLKAAQGHRGGTYRAYGEAGQRRWLSTPRARTPPPPPPHTYTHCYHRHHTH